MEELEKSIRINDLFDSYGKLLTEKQQKMISYYYQDDLSLGEIAEVEGVSRNAVHDAIKKSVNLLEGYEEVLHLLEKKESLESALYLLKSNASKEQLEIIEKIEREVLR